MVLDRDHGVAQEGGDLREAHVPAVLVQREPGLPVRAVEHGVADAPGQATDREVVLDGPPDAVEGEEGGREGDGKGETLHRGRGTGQVPTGAGDEAEQPHASRSLAER